MASISQLIEQPGQIEAQKAQAIAQAQAGATQQIGQAQAQSAQQSGQAWAGAAQNIGNTVAAIPGQIQAKKLEGLKMDDLKGQISERNARAAQLQQDNAAQAAGKSAILASVDWQTGTVDHSKAADLWEKAGFPVQANAYRESVQKTTATAQALTEGAQKIEAGKQQVQQAATNHLGELGAAGLDKIASGATPQQVRDYTMGLVANAASHGLIKEEDATKFLMQAAQAQPGQLAPIFQQFVDAAPSVKTRITEENLKKAETAKNEAEAKKAAAEAAGGKPKALQPHAVLLDGKPSELSYNPDTGAYQDDKGVRIDGARVKPIPPASTTINAALVPSGDALDMAAKRYLATGELPAMGMGQAGAAARVAVMNAAAKLDPTASLALNKATYQSDSKNLANLQKTEGTLSSFENTAGKNLDQFLKLAANIPDTGVPWLNTPVRSVNAKGLGSADQAAFNAARDVAMREIARVTNDPKLSGALTDSARAEVSGLSPASATFAQIKRVAQVLKQDMANVHAGINEQIASVKSGIGSNPSSGTASPPPQKRIYYDAQGNPK